MFRDLFADDRLFILVARHRNWLFGHKRRCFFNAMFLNQGNRVSQRLVV